MSEEAKTRKEFQTIKEICNAIFNRIQILFLNQMRKTAYDLIARKLESIEKTTSVQEAGRIMRDKDVSSLVILDREGRPEGVLTERDIVRKICASEAKEIILQLSLI